MPLRHVEADGKKGKTALLIDEVSSPAPCRHLRLRSTAKWHTGHCVNSEALESHLAQPRWWQLLQATQGCKPGLAIDWTDQRTSGEHTIHIKT